MTEDQERCMTLAEPLLGEFYELWHQAFAKHKKTPPELSAEYDDTTTANCIRSHGWKDVIRRFDERRGFTLLRLRGLNLLLHEDKTVWRFKLVDGAGRHSNYQTKQQQDFDDQMVFPELPPAAVRLTSGYQPDEAGDKIERILVARPMGQEILWASQINQPGAPVAWVDITPERLGGTDRVDFRPRRGRQR